MTIGRYLRRPFRTARAVVEIERARDRAESYFQLATFPEAPYDPGRSDFPSPVPASALHAISKGEPSSSARTTAATLRRGMS
jgi:hypothetical protein